MGLNSNKNVGKDTFDSKGLEISRSKIEDMGGVSSISAQRVEIDPFWLFISIPIPV